MKVRNLIKLAAAFTLVACQNDSVMEALENEVVPMEEQKPVYTTKVTVEDVKHLAGVFNAGKATTKADARTVGSVTTLTDDAGNPTIYVVNYADNKGFVVVSATKNYHPVLAYNDEGNFNLFATELPDALNSWIANKKADVAHADQLPEDSTYRFRAAWSEFEAGRATFVPKAATRSANNSALDSYVMPMLSQWIDEGKEYYSLDVAGDVLPSDIYESWCAIASGAIFPLYEDYMTYSFVVKEYVDNGNTKKNTFLPNWEQRNGYNLYFTTSVPPTTIAVAQLLKHYAHPPTAYPWSAMVNSGPANEDTADFVRDVAEDIGELDGSTASLTNVVTALMKLENNGGYGYKSARRVSHNTMTTRDEIDAGRYVIMQAKDSSNETQAWVVSGYDRRFGHAQYQLWVPVNNAEEMDPYTTIETYTDDYNDYTHIYIHWGGVDSNANGYFLDSNISSNGKRYNSSRYDVIEISPTGI